jgi:hypothetical protein
MPHTGSTTETHKPATLPAAMAAPRAPLDVHGHARAAIPSGMSGSIPTASRTPARPIIYPHVEQSEQAPKLSGMTERSRIGTTVRVDM